MPDLPLPPAAAPGHAFLPGPFTSKGLEDVPAGGTVGYARCECGISSGLRASDRSRRAWHDHHLQDVQARQARRRLPLSVVKVAGHGEDGQEHGSDGGGDVKGSQVLEHGSSRYGERAGGKGLSLAIMRSGAAFAPGPDQVKYPVKAP